MTKQKSEIVSFREDEDKPLMVSITMMESWEAFEALASFLEKHCGATVTDAFDGPDARKWVLQLDDRTFEIHHDDPLGNFLVSVDKKDDPFVRELGYRIKAWLEEQDLGDTPV